MRARKSILFVVLALAIASTLTALAYASTSYFYDLRSNFGIDNVPLGASVVISASTNDSRIDNVSFYWYDPADSFSHPEFVQTKSVYTNGTKDAEGDTLIRYANSTKSVDKIGDWRVYAIFRDVYGNDCYVKDRIVACRHITFNVIPEVPLLGTLGVSIAMVAGLAFRIRLKPQK